MPRLRIEVKGIVQGVGFRPFIYNLARQCHLSGFVLNDTRGVEIEVEGKRSDLDKFLLGIRKSPPPQSRIEELKVLERRPRGYMRFVIKQSADRQTKTVLVSPDLATCDDCLRELFDSSDRRFSYPFLNCTNCGPRLTIIKDVPYDRDMTTMALFRMCADCQREYRDPRNRRFHAQPNACPVCGPRLTLVDRRKRVVTSTDSVGATQALLKKGKIVAVKGIGGYHLACDATNGSAVRRLRKRKYREDKPFALMSRDLSTIARFCRVGPSERALLQSVSRPVVLLKKRRGGPIAPEVAPLQKHWGIMLPYSPLHHLLLSGPDLILVMTSGNRSDEPIAYEDQDAYQRLKDIADYFLVHNRDIHRRCDDSVTRVWNRREMFVRRARGYVPLPIRLDSGFRSHILATGAQLKNTFCLARDNLAFPSTHIGDLENVETLESYTSEIERFRKLCSVEPEVVAHDLHPEYLSTKYARSLPIARKIAVQHHQAHIASCMAENGISERVIGVAFDGTGYGEDGAIWGGEFFVGDPGEFARVAHFGYVQMPGGEAAIKDPWRMAVSYLYSHFGEKFLEFDLQFVRHLGRARWNVLQKMLDQDINLFPTSSAGRLFDCISVLLQWRERSNYEGQPAIELETWADESMKGEYGYDLSPRTGALIIRPGSIVEGVVGDLVKKRKKETIAAKFHNTVARIVADVCLQLREDHGVGSVCLSGGVFQNVFLLDRVNALLTRNHFRVCTHHLVPSNDGGISLGQAVIANQRI